VTDAASSPKGLWKITKWAVHRQDTLTITITPPLSKPDGSLETTPEGKAQLLKATFFPPLVAADLQDITSYDYPTPYRCPVITEAKIERAVRKAAPNTAPGTDGITNGILQKVLDLILPILCQLFNSSLDLGHFPRHFRQSITVVLRKPGKDDYSMPKSYRPIALLNTLSKALEAIIATRLMYLADYYNLLLQMHIKGRKMRSTEHAIHMLLEEIHKAWKYKQVASLLLLDVSGAFDNVSHPRLLHNLRKRKIDIKMVKWVGSFLSNRTITLALPEYKSEPSEVHTGIPQGSPLSPALYLFYNADLLEDYTSKTVGTLGYIDNVSLLAIGATVQHNTQALKIAHRKAEDWARKHGLVFAITKYTLVHFTRNPKVNI
jgi:Reverse transcriptase (RNA-dependent DNA polymerase)